jgi:autotransporter-associated beta strand protein
MNLYSSLAAAVRRCSLILFVSSVACAESAQWSQNPVSGDWNTPANWTPAIVPNGPADIAVFGPTNGIAVSLSQDTEVNGITFTSAATNPYTIGVGADLALTLSGAGVTNNSGITQVLSCNDGGEILFANNASASNTLITSYQGWLQFSGTSTAAAAEIENSGSILFSDGASAGSANIINFSPSQMAFFDSSTAGNANIQSYDNTLIDFFDTSTANSATIQSLGKITFHDFSTGGVARVRIQRLDPVPASGILDISAHSAPGITLGSVEGDGDIFLGANTLTVGTNNLDTTFSGAVHDGSFFDGPTSEAVQAPAIENGALTAPAGGSLIKVGSGTFTLEGFNTYTGDTNVNGGVLQIDGSISSNASVQRRATLAGIGTVDGNLVNNGGTISPGASAGVPGTLTVTGNYTTAPRSAATLFIQLAGQNADQISVLNVEGNATLGGFLEVALIQGFIPQIGQSFTFINYASYTGCLRLRNPVFDHGRKRWSVIYGPTSAALVVVANRHLEPAHYQSSSQLTRDWPR